MCLEENELPGASSLQVLLQALPFSSNHPFPIIYFSGMQPLSIDEGVYGEKIGDTTYLECLWDVYALVSDTGIQYYALNSYNRAISAIVTFMGLMFAATLTGARCQPCTVSPCAHDVKSICHPLICYFCANHLRLCAFFLSAKAAAQSYPIRVLTLRSFFSFLYFCRRCMFSWQVS